MDGLEEEVVVEERFELREVNCRVRKVGEGYKLRDNEKYIFASSRRKVVVFHRNVSVVRAMRN